MKKRFIYSLLFGVPGFFISFLIAFVISGAVSGFLWIYIFGDNPWSSSTEKVVPLFFILALLVLWSAFLTFGCFFGKSLEDGSGMEKKHILASAGMTVVPIALFIFHQLSVGNIGVKSEDMLCSKFCSEKGYSGSSIPPRDSGDRSCSCLDGAGREVIKVPMDSVVQNK